ncbi:hypothetical protein DPMN_165139 [Dreissena polymorpha]|uniref:G-protein coupled receptors family 1 profile domain-containing protein n=2 Tax=Dreissena polymorpha TaxID=45954 RepID=A0A9D4EZR2_DREPO|nr:hypothetical protein DPMN_165139 [Dreissena polymorpha]
MPVQITILFHDAASNIGLKFCDVINNLDVTLTSMSVFHLTMLTWERRVAICNPFGYAIVCSKKRLAIVYTAGWVTVAACSFGIIMPGYQTFEAEAWKLECQVVQPKCQFIVGIYFVVGASLITIVFPIALVLYFNINVICYVKKTRANNNNLGGSCESLTKNRRIRVTVTIAVLTGAFLFCWLPFTVVNVLDTIDGRMVPTTLTIFTLWLGYANSAANPLLYLLMQCNKCIGRG